MSLRDRWLVAELLEVRYPSISEPSHTRVASAGLGSSLLTELPQVLREKIGRRLGAKESRQKAVPFEHFASRCWSLVKVVATSDRAKA